MRSCKASFELDAGCALAPHFRCMPWVRKLLILKGGHMFQHKKISLAVSQAIGLGIAAAVGMGAFAQTATTEKTVVTGSNLRGVLEEQSLPVVVITREELAKSGAVNIEQVVQQLSASSSAGATT